MMNEMEQLAEDSKTRDVSWEEVREAIGSLCERIGEWAGGPIPVDGLRMQLAKGYAFPKLNGFMCGQHYSGHSLDELDVPEDANVKLRNRWFSWAKGLTILVFEVDGKVFHCTDTESTPGTRLTNAINTLGASQAWSMKAEARAMEHLANLVEPHHFRQYFLSGSFMESSKRSGVTYLFRKLRPTVAMRCKAEDQTVKILTTLCLHPIGWYEASYAGCMVPTDDVIAHLLLMRADEWRFWKDSNHHPVWHASCGL